MSKSPWLLFLNFKGIRLKSFAPLTPRVEVLRITLSRKIEIYAKRMKSIDSIILFYLSLTKLMPVKSMSKE